MLNSNSNGNSNSNRLRNAHVGNYTQPASHCKHDANMANAGQWRSAVRCRGKFPMTQMLLMLS